MARNRQQEVENFIDVAIDTFEFGVIVERRSSTGQSKSGHYRISGGKVDIIHWGDDNNLPDYRELLIQENSVSPQILNTKRNIILGGGMMAYEEVYTDEGRKVIERQLPPVFEDFVQEQEDLHDCGIQEMADDYLKHGQYFVEYIRKKGGQPQLLKQHAARCVRAERQNSNGRIPKWWLYGQWGYVTEQQRLEEKLELKSIVNYDASKGQDKFMLRGADKLLGGPYYYHPTYQGNLEWIAAQNEIPRWHFSNIKHGMAPRFIIRIPQDYYMRTLSKDKQKDVANLPNHLEAAKRAFKKRLKDFFTQSHNAGRSLILTKHLAKNMQAELPGVEIEPLTYDLKDEAMLKLYEACNTASTSAHGTPPVLAGISTGAKMTSGSEVKNLYNFYQITAAPSPRRTLLKPYRIIWKDLGLHKEYPNLKLGFRNIELQTTDKSPTGHQAGIQEEKPGQEINDEE